MSAQTQRRAHVIAGGFPPGSPAGHDQDYARLRLLTLLAEQDIPASTGNDFNDLAAWLPLSGLLVTYTAGPYPDAAGCAAMRDWLAAGGRWLALHGTSGGRAERVEGIRQRRTVKMAHHALLGGMFLTHPPIRRFQVDVAALGHPLTHGLGAGFAVEDEPYFVELQDPGAITVLLTATYGDDCVWPATETLYGRDTSLLPDGRARPIAYTKTVGSGSVTYCALGHCHTPAIHAGRAGDTTSARFHGAWEETGFIIFLRNAIEAAAG